MAPSILHFFIEENHIILCQGRVEAELLFVVSKQWNKLFQKEKGKGIWDKPIFAKSMSCLASLLSSLVRSVVCADKGRAVCVVSPAFSRAFGRVSHIW